MELFINKHNKFVDITVNGEVITTTMEHPFHVNDCEWKEAAKLTGNDFFRNKDGIIVNIKEIRIYEVADEVMTYNFEVEEFHTYFVGFNSILCHNDCASMKKGREMQKTLKGYDNTRSIKINTRTRIPDKLTGKVIGEAKYVKYQSYTSQLKDYLAFAGKAELKMHLVATKTTKLSGPLQSLIDKGLIVLKYFG